MSLQRIFQVTYIERLIIYFLVAALFSRVVLEFTLGMWWYKSTQPKLIFLLALIVVDHGIWVLRGGLRRIPPDMVAIGLVTFFGAITLHGILIGAAWGEGPVALMDDTFPLAFLLFTVLRGVSEPQPNLDGMFHRVLWWTAIATIVSIFFGMAGLARGLPTKATPDSIALAMYTALYLALLATEKNGRLLTIHSVLFWPVWIFGIEDLNRSTMAFLAVGSLVAVALRFRVDTAGALFALVVAMAVPLSMPMFLVEGSKTHSRIMTLVDPDLRESSVSLQSRNIEARDIDRALKHAGREAEIFGLGHGASYEFRIFHQFEPEHSHAHYATAFFNLRYGAIGKGYVVAIGVILLAVCFFCIASRTPMIIFFGMMALTSFIYLFTYANFFNFLFGLPLVGLLAPFRHSARGFT
ncbi:MAG: hypothetical protein AAF253_04660 [Pseudomonadota bacterium]